MVYERSANCYAKLLEIQTNYKPVRMGRRTKTSCLKSNSMITRFTLMISCEPVLYNRYSLNLKDSFAHPLIRVISKLTNVLLLDKFFFL